jgi:AcrR family transcriptional regulator
MAQATGRERILEATYACVARYGLAKTTVEDAARESGLSRATVYRYFPGGKDQLIAEVIAWEAQRFFVRLAEAVSGADSFGRLVEDALVFAHRAVEEHEVLQKILVTEPDRLLPQLTLEGTRLKQFVSAFLLGSIEPAQLKPGITPGDAADYVARMLLSYINGPGRWDLTDRIQVRQLVEAEIIAPLFVTDDTMRRD